MLVIPAFNNTWRVSVSGTRVTVVEHWYERTRGGHPAPIGEAERLEGRAELTQAHAKALARLMRERIASASDVPQMGADGAVYIFHAGNACASTWSPDSASGAGRLTRIGEVLGYQASRVDPVQQAQAEQALVPLLRSFEHRLGDAPIPERDDELSLYLGPLWNEAARQRSKRYAD